MNEDEEQNLAEDNGQVPAPPGIRKLLHKGKEAGKEVAKKARESISKGIKAIWTALPVVAKLVIIVVVIFVILCACVVTVLASYTVKSSNTSLNNYMNVASASSTGSNLYKNTSSLTLIENSKITEIQEDFLEEIKHKDSKLYTLLNKKYGSKPDSDVNLDTDPLSPDETKSLYEHFLNTEKYNFNKIKWVKYTRSKEDGTLDMKVDTVTRLQYPDDSKETSLETFVNMLQPYLQNYLIPYSLYSGLITDSRLNTGSSKKELSFGYELVKNMYHDIQVNQYNMESYTKVTSENVYDILNVTATGHVKYKDGAIQREWVTFSTNVTKSCVHDKEELVNEYTKNYIKYKVKYAKLFDKYIINEYNYTEYNLENEPDDQTILRKIYKDSNYEQYEAGKCPVSFNYELSVTDGKVVDGTYTDTKEFEAKKGYTDTVTSTWKDLLEPVSHEERAYTVEDVEEGIESSNLTPAEKRYYSDLECKTSSDSILERLNLFDILNSKSSIYNNYLRTGENYSKNIGYNRSYLTFSFYALKQAVKEIENNSGWKYFYGSSIGAKEATISSATSSESSSYGLTEVDYSSLPEGKLGWPAPRSCYFIIYIW